MKKLFSLLLIAQLTTAAAAQVAKQIATDKIPGSNCDNIVHKDLLVGAQNRTPSECEVQFDWKIRTALRNAFLKTFGRFPETDWMISDTAIKTLTEIGRETEKNFFNTSYYFKIDLGQQSPMYKEWYDKYQAATEGLKAGSDNASKNFLDFMYKMNNVIHIKFYIGVNDVSERIYFLKSGQQQVNIPGAALAVKGPRAAGLSGGGDDNAVDACLIVFGRSKITSQKESNGGTSYTIENIFPKGTSHLTVQQVSIRIECNDGLLNTILKEVDFTAIKAMIK